MIVDDLVRAHGKAASATGYGLRIATATAHSDAVEVRQIGIDHGRVGCAAQHDATCSFILGSSMDPGAVEDDVIGGAVLLVHHEVINERLGSATGNLESDEAVVVGAVGDVDGAAAAPHQHNFR